MRKTKFLNGQSLFTMHGSVACLFNMLHDLRITRELNRIDTQEALSYIMRIERGW